MSSSKNENFPRTESAIGQNKIGFYFSLVQWIVSSVFCVYYLTMGIGVLAVVIAFATCTGGQLGAAFLFWKSKNYVAVATLCVFTQLCCAQVFFFPELGKEINIFLTLVVLFPLFLLEEIDHTVVFSNLAGCLLILACSELLNYQDIPISKQIFSFLCKFTLIIFNFGQVYFLRTYLEQKQALQNDT
ncbi:MAG: hypothetical protein OM95_12005 [Bdellovibrio sp. ArHS]|uniref:hypothetical protein n=1 Tax=Bdellovibrio sp. ArHS TaxID=1569284 RepID=UPI0005824A6D|nr:hypothetical protein [Bdellovibrio sp. ArHS]KHD87739.1 MAG: hypothetical protein OM95_12005 [Bdellovibrio sp. ArHS]